MTLIRRLDRLDNGQRDLCASGKCMKCFFAAMPEARCSREVTRTQLLAHCDRDPLSLDDVSDEDLDAAIATLRAILDTELNGETSA